MFWRYAFTACEKDATRTPRAVFERHRLKGASEQGFSEVLADLDLHHPPCLSLMANRAYYALVTAAIRSRNGQGRHDANPSCGADGIVLVLRPRPRTW